MSQYPRDEFDRVPESASRQGVHRERIVPPRSGGLVAKIIAGLLVLAVGLAAYFLFPRFGLGPASEVSTETAGQTAAAAEEPASPEASGEPSGEPSEEPSEEPSPTATATPGAPASASPGAEPSPAETEAAAAVDRTAPVAVLNATTVGGLASTAAGRLQTGGWTVTQVGNWTGQPLQGSVVLYNSEDQRATAEELAAALGIPTVQGGATFSPNITVVVGPGFQ